MARKKSKRQKPEKSTKTGSKGSASPAAANDKRKPPKRKGDGVRETVESIVVAFILAFLFRTFEAEAFVIPTGSMAPTLYGRHKDVTCEQCGYHFAVGASDELGDERKRETSQLFNPAKRIRDVFCPNCRYVIPAEVVRNLPVFKGDRILVIKYPFEISDPRRWNVVVFKYPEEPYTNYIKRLVGLPGELIEVRQGDVYRETKEGIWEILRKDDPRKQKEMQILVYDNDHPARKLLDAGWPERWAPLKAQANDPDRWSTDAHGWSHDADQRSFRLSAEATADGDYRWIRYRHFVPHEEDWNAVLAGKKPPAPREQLISDFCSYNAYRGGGNGADPDLGTYWVGDLTINCQVEIHKTDQQGELLLELIEGERTYRCRFHLATGLCEVFHLVVASRDEEEKILGRAETALKGTGTFRVTFANVDDRLRVWVNDRPVDFSSGEDSPGDGTYHPYGALLYQKPTRRDLSPVGIAARHCELSVSHLLLQRDIYYRAEMHVPPSPGAPPSRYMVRHEHYPVPVPVGEEPKVSHRQLHEALGHPAEWWRLFQGLTDTEPNQSPGPYPARFARLADDEFFMMGDNSPRSQDSRLWPNTRGALHRHAVPRKLLVGKAFFIYWPHGIPFLNDGKGIPVTYHRNLDGSKSDYPSFRLPFYPNFRRMHRIR